MKQIIAIGLPLALGAVFILWFWLKSRGASAEFRLTAAETQILENINKILNKAGCPIGSHDETYTLVKRVVTLIIARDYFMRETDRARAVPAGYRSGGSSERCRDEKPCPNGLEVLQRFKKLTPAQREYAVEFFTGASSMVAYGFTSPHRDEAKAVWALVELEYAITEAEKKA